MQARTIQATKTAEPAARREAERLGELGLHGWRKHVAKVAAPRIAAVTPLRDDQARAWIGIAFVALSAWHVGATMFRFARRAEPAERV